MPDSQCFKFLLVFVVTLHTNAQTNHHQASDENAGRFSDDFMQFVKNIESMVYKTSTTSTTTTTSQPTAKTTTRSSQNASSLQKTALRDVLMMKLVSYYEDKYRLNHESKSWNNGMPPTLKYNNIETNMIGSFERPVFRRTMKLPAVLFYDEIKKNRKRRLLRACMKRCMNVVEENEDGPRNHVYADGSRKYLYQEVQKKTGNVPEVIVI